VAILDGMSQPDRRTDTNQHSRYITTGNLFQAFVLTVNCRIYFFTHFDRPEAANWCSFRHASVAREFGDWMEETRMWRSWLHWSLHCGRLSTRWPRLRLSARPRWDFCLRQIYTQYY